MSSFITSPTPPRPHRRNGSRSSLHLDDPSIIASQRLTASPSLFGALGVSGPGDGAQERDPSVSTLNVLTAVSLRLNQAMMSSAGNSIMLTGDVSALATHVQMYVVDATSEAVPHRLAPGQLIYERHYVNANFRGFSDILSTFLRVSGARFPDYWPVTAVLAVSDPLGQQGELEAGAVTSPVNQNKVTFKFPNGTEWIIDGAELMKSLSIHRVRLVNHFGACGYGLLTLSEHETVTLQQGSSDSSDAQGRPPPMAMIGADSRLGECYMTGRPDGKYDIWPTEGGHTEFTPRTELEVEMFLHLKKALGASNRISIWRVVSWWGLYNVYSFLRAKYPEKVRPAIDSAIEASGEAKGEVVARFAGELSEASRIPNVAGARVAGGLAESEGQASGQDQEQDADELCRMALKIVVSTFGSEAGVAALKYNPTGGLFICGGLVSQLLPFFVDPNRKWNFISCLVDKGRMRPLLEKLPVKVVMVDNLAQRGVKLLAFRQLQKAHLLYSDIVLTGDVGGTNCRLQLHAVSDVAKIEANQPPPGDLMFEHKYQNQHYRSFKEILEIFLRDAGCSPGDNWPVTACLAVAGPVSSNRVQFTNREDWVIDGHKLAQQLHFQEVRLVNDFAANGYGLLTLRPQEIVTLQEGNVENMRRKHDRPPPMACIGAGTGLGECYLTGRPDGNYDVWPTEGGHTDFSPRSELELELLEFLKDKFGQTNRVSVERVVSGGGLYSVYCFLREKFPDKVDVEIDAAIEAAGDMKGMAITQHVDHTEKRNELCASALKIVVSTYGAEAGSAALKWAPRGGMYIAGGIAPKNIRHFLEHGLFMDNFLDKGAMKEMLKEIPVHIVMTEDIGERGAKLLAVRMLMKLRGTFGARLATGRKGVRDTSAPSWSSKVGEMIAYPVVSHTAAAMIGALGAMTLMIAARRVVAAANR